MAEILKFDQWISSARGLISKVVLPSNVLGLREHFASGSYSVTKLGSADPPATGPLDIATVMFVAPQTWSRDPQGMTFLWQAPGTLWPTVGNYRIVITLVTTPLLGNLGILLVFEANAKDPLG